MAKQKVVATRISEGIYDSIAAIAKKEGVSISAVAARLLTVGLSQPDKKPDWAMDIEQRVSQLERKVSEQSSGQAGGKGRGKRRR